MFTDGEDEIMDRVLAGYTLFPSRRSIHYSPVTTTEGFNESVLTPGQSGTLFS